MRAGHPKHPRMILWVQALRSGEYSQGQRALTYYHPRKDCCMGVLCDISGVRSEVDLDRVRYGRSQAGGLPPIEVVRWLGFHRWKRSRSISHSLALNDPDKTPLAVLNDQRRLSFDQIADLIEKYGVTL